jgi:4,5-DOPA dioxygenase extradiol
LNRQEAAMFHESTPGQAAHPFAQHQRQAAAIETAHPHQLWSPQDAPLPALFLGHGAPPLLEDRHWMTQLHTWARSLPKPRAILVVSAHWEAAPLAITSAAPGPDLVYDFGGFPQIYYTMRYETPEATELASQLRALLTTPGSGGPAQQRRGLDHGAWVPLKAMFPVPEIPVLQLSIPTQDPTRLLELGTRLRPLRELGVLIIGSGFLTHGLPYLDWHHPERVPGWSTDFDAWAAEALARGDLDELAAFRDRAPGMPFAHPTVEHFSPIFVTLGAADDPTTPPETTIDGYFIGLSKRSFQTAG